MSGCVIFFVCIPTAGHEYCLLFDTENTFCKEKNKPENIDLCILNAYEKYKTKKIKKNENGMNTTKYNQLILNSQSYNNVFISMEVILNDLLKKLKIEHAVWYKDQTEMYYQIIFPIACGHPCENCLHYLTEFGIGLRMNSKVSVLPTQCSLRGLQQSQTLNESKTENHNILEQDDIWKLFISSLRSKLNIKQVIDSIRSSSEITFDYILLILTADCLAVLGLIESNATNIIAAMLVSPLMGPVMSLTFGTIVADKQLQLIGIKSLLIGIVLSIIFGFICGILLGITTILLGYNNWPTDEMKGRSLWMGILWGLPSGIGVAIALLQGNTGPLIGVAISASLLPPVVNCGLFLALSCIYLMYQLIQMPNTKENLFSNFTTTYVHIYADYLPLDLFFNGIISACLTIVNIICIFLAAILVLKIKEVAAPYTSSPELRRFWKYNIRLIRENNEIKNTYSINSSLCNVINIKKKNEFIKSIYNGISESITDDIFHKIQRFSYEKNKKDQRFSLNGIDIEINYKNFEKNISMFWNEFENIILKNNLVIFDKIVKQFIANPLSDYFFNKKNNHLYGSFKKFNKQEYAQLLTDDTNATRNTIEYNN